MLNAVSSTRVSVAARFLAVAGQQWVLALAAGVDPSCHRLIWRQLLEMSSQQASSSIWEPLSPRLFNFENHDVGQDPQRNIRPYSVLCLPKIHQMALQPSVLRLPRTLNRLAYSNRLPPSTGYGGPVR
ncbi:hypothetical protein J3458_005665 [Metarhizium acridum]|uniref:uncharacterized protein n=1 Tax=Metarhizium acridum TaxID=92637 RepID=UPI001C6C600E|nr:hypothetical protein J3458_005665 [Metarhizium acridum]